MFGNVPSQALIHQGSYLLPILGFAAAVAGARAAFPRFAVWLVIANALFSLAINVPSFTPLRGTGYSPLAIAICVASLIAFLMIAFESREPVAGLLATLRRHRRGGLARA